MTEEDSEEMYRDALKAPRIGAQPSNVEIVECPQLLEVPERVYRYEASLNRNGEVITVTRQYPPLEADSRSVGSHGYGPSPEAAIEDAHQNRDRFLDKYGPAVRAAQDAL